MQILISFKIEEIRDLSYDFMVVNHCLYYFFQIHFFIPYPLTNGTSEVIWLLIHLRTPPNKGSIHEVETILELIRSELASGQNVMISGFGKFCVISPIPLQSFII